MPGLTHVATSSECTWIGRQWIISVAAICLLVFAVRAVLLSYLGCISADGVFYLEIADRYRQGLGAFDPIFPPLYPALTAWMSAIVPNLETAGQLVSAVAGALGVVPVVILGRIVFNTRASLYAGVLYALHPGLALYGSEVMSEALFTSLLAAAWVAGYYLLIRPSRYAAIATGLLLGLATLARPEAASYLIAALVVFVWRGYRRRSERRALAQHTGLLVLMFCLITFPYANYLKQTTGRWTLSGKTSIMLAKAGAVGSEDIGIGVDRRMRESGRPTGIVDDLMTHPFALVRRVLTNGHLTHKYVIPELLPPLLLIAVALGLVRYKPKDKGQTYLLACTLPYIPVLAFVVDPRVFLPLVPLGLLWAGTGLAGLQDRLSETGIGSRLSRVQPLLLILLLNLLPFTARPLYRTDENAVYKRAGVWLRANESGPLKIAFPKPWVAYYAGGDRVGVPATSLSEGLKRLRQRSVTHLVVDTRITPAVRPAYIRLLDDQSPPPGVIPLHHLSDPLGQHVYIYRIETTS